MSPRILFVSLFLFATTSFACRPDLAGIQATMLERAAALVATTGDMPAMELVEKPSRFEMFFVKTDSGLSCPDHYIMQVRAQAPAEVGATETCHRLVTISVGTLAGGDVIGPKICRPVERQ